MAINAHLLLRPGEPTLETEAEGEDSMTGLACGRCGLGHGTTGSYFDTAMICDECVVAELAHSDFKRARDIECAAVMAGNYNYPGIGLPADLAAEAQLRRKTRRLEQVARIAAAAKTPASVADTQDDEIGFESVCG